MVLRTTILTAAALAVTLQVVNAFTLPLASTGNPALPTYRSIQTTRDESAPSSSSSSLSMVDPISFAANAALDIDLTLEMGVAVVSAAAGAMSQLPRIQSLEREVQAARNALTASEIELVDKIKVLEDKLFLMDQEFEEQTARFKRQYDRTLREQMETVKEKLKQEMQFKVEIELAKERSAKLMNQAVAESGRTSKQEELSQMKLKQLQMEDLNQKLEDALKSAETELVNMRGAKGSKKRFLIF
jgi:prophage DNA circulation protein